MRWLFSHLGASIANWSAVISVAGPKNSVRSEMYARTVFSLRPRAINDSRYCSIETGERVVTVVMCFLRFLVS